MHCDLDIFVKRTLMHHCSIQRHLATSAPSLFLRSKTSYGMKFLMSHMAFEQFTKLQLTSYNVFRTPSTTSILKRVVGSCLVRDVKDLYKRLLIHRNVDPIGKKEDYINLSSFHIEKETIPESWPFAALLGKGSGLNPTQQSIESGNVDQDYDSRMFKSLFIIIIILVKY